MYDLQCMIDGKREIIGWYRMIFREANDRPVTVNVDSPLGVVGRR